MVKNLFEKFGLTACSSNSAIETYLRIESVDLFLNMQKSTRYKLFDYVYQNGWYFDEDLHMGEQNVLMFKIN